jgi:nucleoside-diphosphate-sugar epimerase
MKVLVTGHLGYIGRVLTAVFVNEGHEVVGLDSGWFSKCTFDYPATDVPYFKTDLRNVKVSDLAEFDSVIHLAGICNDPLGNLNPELTMEINQTASLRFALMAKEAGVKRFLFSSSCSIYGGSGSEIVTEESVQRPVTVYGHTKQMLELALRDMGDSRFCPVFLRNATAYGPSRALRLDLVLNEFVADACATGRILIRSDGTPWRPVVHVEDISYAFLAAMTAPAHLVWNEAFNVGSNRENYQIQDLAEIVCEVVPGSSVEFAAGGAPDKRCYRVDFSKIRRHLPDFRSRWTAAAGARQLYEAYLAAGLKQDDFRSPRFRRLDHIQSLLSSHVLDERLRWRGQSPHAFRSAPMRASH